MQYAIIDHQGKTVDLFNKKIDAIYFQQEAGKRKLRFMEIFKQGKLPPKIAKYTTTTHERG